MISMKALPLPTVVFRDACLKCYMDHNGYVINGVSSAEYSSRLFIKIASLCSPGLQPTGTQIYLKDSLHTQ
jgi:hypothetical protein